MKNQDKSYLKSLKHLFKVEDEYSLTSGTIHASYYEQQNGFQYFNTIGLLVDSHLVIIPTANIPPQLLDNQAIRIKYIPQFEDFKNDSSDCLSTQRISKINSKEDVAWGVICLSNPIGEFIFQISNKQSSYFYLEDYKKISVKKKLAVVFFQNSNSKKNIEGKGMNLMNMSMVSHATKMEEEERYITEFKGGKIGVINFDQIVMYFTCEKHDQIFLFVKNAEKLKISQAFVIIGNQIVAIMRRLISLKDFEEKAKSLEESTSMWSEYLMQKNEMSFEGAKIGVFEADLLKNSDIALFQATLKYIRNECYSDVGMLNFSESAFTALSENIPFSYKTLCICGERILSKTAERLKLPCERDLDKDMIIRRILDTKNEKERLELVGFHFEENYIITLINSCYFNSQLAYLNLTATPLNQEQCESLAFLLFHKKNLVTLILAHTQLPMNGFYLIIQALCQDQQKISNFQFLDISQTFIYPNQNHQAQKKENHLKKFFKSNEKKFCDSLDFLADLTKISTLKFLIMRGIQNFKYGKNDTKTLENSIFSKSLEYLENDVAYSSLQLLNLSMMDLSTDVVKSLCKYLVYLIHLDKLILSQCHINNEGAKELISAIISRKKNKMTVNVLLSVLDLSSNGILSQSCAVVNQLLLFYTENEGKLAEEDLKEKSCYSIYLHDNTDLHNVNAQMYNQILFNPHAPMHLDLSNVGIVDTELDALGNNLAFNDLGKQSALVKLNLSNNGLTDEKIARLYHGIAANKYIRLVYLHNNKDITPVGIMKFVDAIVYQGPKQLTIVCDPIFDEKKDQVELKEKTKDDVANYFNYTLFYRPKEKRKKKKKKH